MPIRRRIRRTYFSDAGTSLLPFSSCVNGVPSTQMTPSFTFSSVMSSRRIVVFPDPLGPIRVTRSPRAT